MGCLQGREVTGMMMGMGMGVGMVMLLVGSGCTRLLNHEVAQCKTDDDCQVFHYHPFCNKTELVCEPSGLAPDHCFFATPNTPPTKPLDFLNRCTVNFLPGSPASELGACLEFDQGAIDPGATIKDPPPPAPPPPIDRTDPVDACAKLVPAGKTVLYITGSSNFQPLLQELADVVVAESNFVPVFRITTSCTGVKSMNPKSPTYNADHFIRDPSIASDNYAQIFLASDRVLNCTLGGGATGIPVDLGESEIYPETCDTSNSVEDTFESLGPILPIEFVVPKGSPQVVISYEAARQVFGGGGGVRPWNQPSLIFVRGAGTATLRLVAKQLNLMPAQVWGLDQGSAGNLAQKLAVQGESAAAIGIIGADFYDSDTNRGMLRALAFQADQQGCAFLPDASFYTFDKINVRDGHYPLWGRIHLFTARVNSPGLTPAQQFALLLTNPKLDQRILDAFIDAHFVPPCAMKVRRDTELGELTNDDPAPNSCGCAFDAYLNPNSPPAPECKPCMVKEDCPSDRPLCTYYFCEAR